MRTQDRFYQTKKTIQVLCNLFCIVEEKRKHDGVAGTEDNASVS